MKQKIFLSLFFLPIIITGLTLARWQHQRSEWKKTVLTDFTQKLKQQHQALPTLSMRFKGDYDAISGGNGKALFEEVELYPIKITGKFEKSVEFYRPVSGGFEVIVAFRTNDGVIPMNVGFVSGMPNMHHIPQMLPKTEQTLTGFFRIPEHYAGDAPKNKSLVSKIPFTSFYNTYKQKLLAGAIQLDNHNSSLSGRFIGKKSQDFIKNIPNNHIQYMWTWVFLSLIATVIYSLLLKKTQNNI